MKPPTESAPTPFNATMLPLAKIHASPTNPRKKFPAGEQKELEESMRARGFTISTLLVRPGRDTFRIDAGNEESQSDGQFFVMKMDPAGIESSVEMLPSRGQAEKLLAELQGCYELVAGERRWRAARAVGITEVPCIISGMTDSEVLEIQLIENLQRKDLTSMETAMGFQALIAMPNHSVQTIHEKTGMSVRYIERHLRLCVLTQDIAMKEFVKALDDGLIGMKHAELAASIPDAGMRMKFVKDVMKPQYAGEPLSVRAAQELKSRDYMVDLRNATFDLKDATLLAVETDEGGRRVAGGDCMSCPNRLGNAPELFEGGKVPTGLANMCQNPACAKRKKEAGWKHWQDEETDLAKKRTALSEEECRKLYSYGDQMNYGSKFVDLADRPDSTVLKPGAKAPGTWRSMVKGSEIAVTVAKDRNGRVHELVDVALAIAAAETNDHKIFKKEKAGGSGGGGGGLSGGGSSGGSRVSDADRDARIEQQRDDDEVHGAVFTARAAVLADKASAGKALPDGFWSEAVSAVMDDFYDDAFDPIEARRGWKNGSMVSEMRKLQPHHQAGVLAEVLWSCAEIGGPGGDHVLKMFGVDGKAIEKSATAAVKVVQKERAALRKEIAELMEKTKSDVKAVNALVDKHAKELTAEKGDKLAKIRDVATITKIRDELLKKAGGVPLSVLPEKLRQQARALRKAGKAKSVGELSDALKLAPQLAGMLLDLLIDEERDAKEKPAAGPPAPAKAEKKAPKQKGMSPEARAKIVAAAKARWAKVKGGAK